MRLAISGIHIGLHAVCICHGILGGAIVTAASDSRILGIQTRLVQVGAVGGREAAPIAVAGVIGEEPAPTGHLIFALGSRPNAVASELHIFKSGRFLRKGEVSHEKRKEKEKIFPHNLLVIKH